MAYFGFKSVGDKEKDGLVRSVFDTVSDKYDLMNDLMSLGLHRVWKNKFVQEIDLHPGMRVLDMSSGTGDIASRLLSREKHLDMFALDPNFSMLSKGKSKQFDKGVVGMKWIVGRAEQVPLVDNSMDLYTISFGLRNVTNLDLALGEAFRVIKKGGIFRCLEFTPDAFCDAKNVHKSSLDFGRLFNNKLARGAYDLYSFGVIPKLGKMVVGDESPYKYLAESIRKFPTVSGLEGKLRDAGFVSIRSQIWGAVAVHQCEKP